jgi:hypothetical protein
VKKTLTVGVPRIVICSVLSSRRSDDLLPKITFVANGNNPPSVGLALGKTIYFGSLVFTANRFSHLSLSPEGDDSRATFAGMVHNGS